MITKIYTGSTIGIKSYLVTTEISLKPADKAKFFIVGMGDTAIQESKKRITAAFESNDIYIGDKEIAVNLAPADIKKEGAIFDFPIACGILLSLGKIEASNSFLEETLLFGELSFDGQLRPIKSILSLAIEAKLAGKKRLILPYDNIQEASVIPGLIIIGLKNIKDLYQFFSTKEPLYKPTISQYTQDTFTIDYSDIKGQNLAKRLLQIAAAGHHNVIFVGPPGSGKTMLAERLPTIMSPLSFDEIIETTRIYSSIGLTNNTLITQRPFRAPHHNISSAGLIGGGQPPQPGEISLAHNGILFLDELPEFKRNAIESLRQPLEDKTITLTKGQVTIELPANFLMIAALNPCPCGYLGDSRRECTCSYISIYNYMNKISGPFLDRIDLQLYIHGIEVKELQIKTQEQTSAQLYEGVMRAYCAQQKRFNGSKRNSLMTIHDIEEFCPLNSSAQQILNMAYERLKLSMRGYHKIIRISRTIADIAGSETIEDIHIKEALSYRGIDQKMEQFKTKL